MIKLTNGIEAKKFITKELMKKLGTTNRSSIINIDYCSLPTDDLDKYFKACYENVFFPYKNYSVIYSYSLIKKSESVQIEKTRYEIKKHSNHNKPILFITSLNKEKLDLLNIEKLRENIFILNIDKYEIKKIPNKIEKLISLFIISIPLQYWIYNNLETVTSFIENNKKSLIDLLKVISILIINFGSLLLLIYFTIWIFKAFALHIKGLLTLSIICILTTLVSLWNFNNIFLFLPGSFIITLVPMLVLWQGYDSNFKGKIINAKDDSIWDPITYFKNKIKKKEEI